MASVVYNAFKQAVAQANIDLDADDIRVALVMSNTTVDTENDAKVYVGDFTTLDECDGANYVRKALANEAVNKDDANDRAEFDADDVTWTALGVGTRTTVGVLIYKHVTIDADSPAIAFVEFASPVTHDGTDFTIQALISRMTSTATRGATGIVERMSSCLRAAFRFRLQCITTSK